MGQRLPNPRRAKIHRSYTVEEVAELYALHPNTVRQWIKRDGLPVCDDQRPLLILGSELAAFLARKRTANKRACQPGELYCLRCRTPQRPALGMVDYQPLTATGGNLVGLCSCCEGLICRRVSLATLMASAGNLDVRIAQGQEHISESSKPCVNSDSQPGA